MDRSNKIMLGAMLAAAAFGGMDSPTYTQYQPRKQRAYARISRYQPRAQRSKYQPHQGAKERARRIRQMGI